jgi:hypothetical protein
MSESDSFIQEVTEEVRRDRLFGYLRRYAWIAALAVALIVGGAAFNEWRKAQTRAEAQALGDAILAALEAPSPDARAEALAALDPDAEADDLVALLRAAERQVAGATGDAAAALRPLASAEDGPVAFADLAALKLVLMGGEAVDAATRAQLLERLAEPGAPFRLLALEQQALALAAEGERAAAIEAARALMEEPGLTRAMAQRTAQLLVALGAEGETGAG